MNGLSPQPSAPKGALVECAACGATLDSLRAGHVAILGSRFEFFCDYGTCRARFLGRSDAFPGEGALLASSLAEEALRELDGHADRVPPPVRGADEANAKDSVPSSVWVDEQVNLFEPITHGERTAEPGFDKDVERRELGLLLVALALIAGVLCMALELASTARLVQVARVVLAFVGSMALMGRAMTSPRDDSRPHALVSSLAPLLATLVAAWALLLGAADGVGRATFLAGTVLTVFAVNLWLVGLASHPVHAWRRQIDRCLAVAGRRVTGAVTRLSPKELTFDLKPGEHVVVEAGETVPVDLEIVEGDVEVMSWGGGAVRARRRPGDVVVAGSRIVTGQLRGVCTWSGDERALARSVLNRIRRADLHADVARWPRSFAERWAPLVALVCGAVLAVLGRGALDVAMLTVAVYAACSNQAIGSLPALAVAGGVRAALARGVVYNDARAWDACARASVAVFCARGTLVRGEPELVEAEASGAASSADEVLGLAAGALASERDPVAVALRRAAGARGIAPDAVRNTRTFAGAGVTAVAAAGDALCVGSRALMLERHISVAMAEQRIYELEGNGRTVVLVAKGGRLAGLLALQDGLRSGARAAVQHLMDARIEPVLMSSDSRDTCEALGRALDIDHLRSEVFADARAAEVQRIKDAGAVVAVLGHTHVDESALSAADASIALAAAGSARDGVSVAVVSDDVRDGALALALAHRTRRGAMVSTLLTLGPAGLGALVSTAALLPPEYAPLAQLVGAVTAVWHLRSQ